MKPDYIFISGVSRTGSTLFLSILNRTTNIAIAWENWFLGHQTRREGIRHVIKKRIGGAIQNNNADALIDFLYNARFKRSDGSYWRWLRQYTDRDVFLEKLLAAPDRSDRSIFHVMMEMYGDWMQQRKRKFLNGIPDNPVLGEKTPSHIYYVPTILEWFSNSKVVHTFRDPRAVFASELRRRKKYPPRFPFSLITWTGPLFGFLVALVVTYTWLKAVKLHFKYEKLFPGKYCLVKFEDLVTAPEKTVRDLCDFLEIEFQDIMLGQKVISKGIREGQEGFDSQAATRWKKTVPFWARLWFRLFCGRKMKKFGYTD